MNLDFLSEFYMPVVLLICLMVGYCIKHIKWLDAIANEYIPTIVAILGAVLGCIYAGETTLVAVASGAFSGLASTGAHQLFKQWINKE